MSKILVIGSINIDFVFETNRVPLQGETVSGENFNVFDGGKGANQAIAASRYGASVDFVGAVGNDEFATRSIINLENNGVDTKEVIKLTHTHTGVANILVNNNDNRIIIIEGANSKINEQNFNFEKLINNNYSYVLIQSEIPSETIERVIDICKQKEIKVIYNPAPFKDIGEKFLLVDYITPNETEFNELIRKYSIDKLLASGVTIVKTCGSEGVEIYEKNKVSKVTAPEINVVDTTGAGDTFNGVFSAGLASGLNVSESAENAVKCASYSTTKLGAQSGMPFKGEIC